MTELIIMQADIDVAADFLESWEPGPEMTVVKLARAFAKHREDTEALIVGWLRADAKRLCDDPTTEINLECGLAIAECADAIEAGDHHTNNTPGD